MTVDELKSMPKGHFVVMKTGCHPMKIRLQLFLNGVFLLRKLILFRRNPHGKSTMLTNVSWNVLFSENILRKLKQICLMNRRIRLFLKSVLG